jgi:rhodanese-related sulfurtransferase
VCLALVLFLVSIIFITGCYTNSSKEWERIKKKIRSDFPTVSHISTEKLDNLLVEQQSVKPILLDTRETEEYAVSHLPGAYLATTEEKALKIIIEKGKNHTIVVYCSVGNRSAVIAKKLQTMGVTNIFNLEGSIFKWANEGRDIYRGDHKVSVVHPYNSKWKELLDERLWSRPNV